MRILVLTAVIASAALVDEAIYLADRVIVLYGSPAVGTAAIPIPLGRRREQIATRSGADFARLGAQVIRLIHNGAADHSGVGQPIGA